MLDSVLMTNEILDEVKRTKKRCIVVKVNFEKAYDSINEDFMCYMMEMLGFSNTW